MDDFSNKRVLIWDEGQFVGLAERLARDWGSVQYFKPWKKSAPTTVSLLVGDGLDGVERVPDFFDAVPGADLIVFPDCYQGDLQLYLESSGKRVWGSRKAERLEFMREEFKDALKQVGLPVVPYKVIKGITRLREHLMEYPNQIVKLSLCRGDGETFDCPSYALRKSKIDALEYYFGPCAEKVRFVVEDMIETSGEVGYDGICIDGQFTDGFVDYEIKNEACLIAVTKYDDMADPVREVNEKFGPLLKDLRCRSTLGTEIRLDEKGTPFFIDLTARTASPPGEALWELCANLSEIMYHGSDGEFVQFEEAEKFGCEIMIYMDWQDMAWQEVHVPDEHRQWVKFACACKVDDMHYPIANEGYGALPWGREGIGSVIGIGETIEKAIDAAKEHAESIEGFKIHYNIAAIANGIEAIKGGQEHGIEFGEEEIPDPKSVIANG